jgi:hypothetical protein
VFLVMNLVCRLGPPTTSWGRTSTAACAGAAGAYTHHRSADFVESQQAGAISEFAMNEVCSILSEPGRAK